MRLILPVADEETVKLEGKSLIRGVVNGCLPLQDSRLRMLQALCLVRHVKDCMHGCSII